MTNTLRLFITTIVGFEKELLGELHTCSNRILSSRVGKGGVYAEVGSFQDVLFLNYFLHTANRVLVEMISLSNPRPKDITNSLYNVDWTPYFRSDETFCIEVPFSTHPDFTNTLYAAQCMKDPICDRLRKETGKRPSVDTKDPKIRFQALLTENEFCFYFDSSTLPLFKRGYRDIRHMAPLKETLAAALLLRSGFQPEQDILIDPCSGSGTFVIEALLLKYNISPGLLRKEFGFFSHPLYDLDEDRALKKSLIGPFHESIVSGGIQFMAIEKDPMAYKSILRHLASIGMIGKAQVINRGFQSVDMEEIMSMNEGEAPTFCITNPPYGIRMKSEQDCLQKLYSDLGFFMKKSLRFGGISAVLMPEDHNLQRCIGMKSKWSFPVSQGGLNCRCVGYEIFSQKNLGN